MSKLLKQGAPRSCKIAYPACFLQKGRFPGVNSTLVNWHSLDSRPVILPEQVGHLLRTNVIEAP